MISSPIDEIKNRLDIVEVVGSYIKLQKAGANFRAVCPFHSEKKPSFFISPARQIWHCFGGCSEGGDIFKFIMKIEGVEFGDALRILAQRAGVELKKQSIEYKKWQSERENLYEICEIATKFFEKQLEESKVGKEAKKYLLDRGINQESIKKWRLGYAPDVWQGLSDFLNKRGYKKIEVEKAGLGLTSEKGSFYDRFRGRIIFPIFDMNSQIVGFGGRVFREKDKAEISKYVNTPQTLLYDKSRILYGLDKAKIELRKKDGCILVEGYTDVIMAHQSGSQNVVATSGTALTSFQLKILKRYTENLLLGFDMDFAGNTATKRGIDLAQTLGFNIKVLRLLEGKDAAEIILHDVKKWEQAINNPKSIMDFYFESTFSNRDAKDPDQKKKISEILLPIIKRISNKIVQAHWLGKLAEELEVKEERVEEELKKVKIEGYSDAYGLEPEEIANLPLKSRKDLLEENLLILVLKSSENIDLVEKNLFPLFSLKIQEILIDLLEKKTPTSELYNAFVLRSEIEEIEEKEIVPEIKNCLREIQSLNIKEKLEQISKEIKKAEDKKEIDKIKELTEQFKDLSSQLISL